MGDKLGQQREGHGNHLVITPERIYQESLEAGKIKFLGDVGVYPSQYKR